MTGIAERASWRTTSAERSMCCVVTMRDDEDSAADCAESSAFLTDLAERLAAICMEQQGRPTAGAERAIPLSADPYPRSELIDGQVTPSVAEQCDNPPAEHFGISLYTTDGNLRALHEIEADVIRLAICRYRGRMSEVARRLNIGRSTLYRRLEELGIDHTNYRAA